MIRKAKKKAAAPAMKTAAPAREKAKRDPLPCPATATTSTGEWLQAVCARLDRVIEALDK